MLLLINQFKTKHPCVCTDGQAVIKQVACCVCPISVFNLYKYANN